MCFCFDCFFFFLFSIIVKRSCQLKIFFLWCTAHTIHSQKLLVKNESHIYKYNEHKKFSARKVIHMLLTFYATRKPKWTLYLTRCMDWHSCSCRQTRAWWNLYVNVNIIHIFLFSFLFVFIIFFFFFFEIIILHSYSQPYTHSFDAGNCSTCCTFEHRILHLYTQYINIGFSSFSAFEKSHALVYNIVLLWKYRC